MSVHSETPTRASVGPIPVKIVVAGGFGVGKTTFVGAISDIKPLTTEAAMTTFGEGIDNRGDVGTKTTTTVAMDFGRVAVDDAIVLYLFGTPGQDRFGFMWNDLIQGALGAVVLVDSRRIEDSFPALDYFEHRDLPFVGLLLGSGLGGDPLGFLVGAVIGWMCLNVGVALACGGVLWIDTVAQRSGGR